MSYTKSHYHIIFSTYRRKKTIPEEHERELYAYIYGIANNLNCETYRIGGMPDHIHIFVSLHPTISLATFVQRVKTESSKWLKLNPHFPDFQRWERKYAGFSYNYRDKERIINYIMKQKEHHRKKSLEKEYRNYVEENGIVIDDRFFLRDK
ncbi:MAG: IS200/IS605 family transposase [Bacteroidales bacterium]|nr:IS200/IS605 family transposase [Bacteroidales bacterium]